MAIGELNETGLRAGGRITAARPGTAGGFGVTVSSHPDADGPIQSVVISAAHVLCDDPFNCHHSPHVGVLTEALSVARHHSGDVAIAVGCDVACATVIEGVVTENLTHGWHDPGIPPSGVVADEVYDGAAVWMVGATSGLVRGRIVTRQTSVKIRYPDGLHELSFVAVESQESGAPFSRPGDSGAIVYYRSGEALGVLVAGRQGYNSYVSPLAPALRRLGVTLTASGLV